MSTEPTPSTPETTPPSEPTSSPSGYDPKVIGIIAYITLIGWIVALIMNNPKSEFGSFHIRQALAIGLLGLVLSFVWLIPILNLVAAIFILVLWVIGFVGAIQGQKKPVPIIGEKAQEWFQAL